MNERKGSPVLARALTEIGSMREQTAGSAKELAVMGSGAGSSGGWRSKANGDDKSATENHGGAVGNVATWIAVPSCGFPSGLRGH